MKTTTLAQAMKILAMLEDVPCEKTQAVIESGLLSEVIRTGKLDEVNGRIEREKLRAIWNVIERLTKFEGIFITVPKDPRRQMGDKAEYQLRCWYGKYGYAERGHIDGGVDLFELFLPAPLTDCDCCWPPELAKAGVGIQRGDMTREWVKETKQANDGSHYDVVTCSSVTKSV